MRGTLTPRLARAFATKGPKTVQRDLSALVEMGLIVREGRRVRARRELILAFLPIGSFQVKERDTLTPSPAP